MSLDFSCTQNSPAPSSVSPPTNSARHTLAGGKCTQTELSQAQLPISRLFTKKEIDPLVSYAMSGNSSGPVRSGPSVDMNRKRIRVAPSTARMRFDKPGDTQLRGDAAKKVCKRNLSTSENLVIPIGDLRICELAQATLPRRKRW